MYRGWLHPLWLCITGFVLATFMTPIAVNRIVPLLQAPFSSVYNSLQTLHQVSYGRDLVTATVILGDNNSNADVVMYVMNERSSFCSRCASCPRVLSTFLASGANGN